MSAERSLEAVEMISKLKQARRQDANEQRVARRSAWKEEKKQEIGKRVQFQKQQELESKDSCEGAPVHVVPEGSEEKSSLSRRSLQAREQLMEGRTAFLFNEVIKVLFEKGRFDTRERDTQKLLLWRAVCKEWKRSIENCLSSSFEPALSYRNKYGESLLVHLPMCFLQLRNLAELEQFTRLSTSSYTGSNPFPSRKLIIGAGYSLPTWEDNQEYWRSMKIMVRHWGQELWHVLLHFDEGISPEVLYAEICAYLKMMPNLRRLGIYLKRIDNRRTVNQRALRRFQEDVIGSLSERVARTPLPDLPHLTSLLFDDIVPTVVIHAVVSRYGSHLDSVSFEFATTKKLKVFRSLSNRALPPATAGSLPCVKHMNLHYFNLRSHTDVLNSFINVNKHGKLLKSLNLKLDNTASGSKTWIRLTDDVMKSLVLELPQLEILTLDLSCISLNTIDFLLPCVSLKELNLEYTEVSPRFAYQVKTRRARPIRPPYEKIKFNQYTKRLYDSNIWKLFPKLKQVAILTLTRLTAENCRGVPPMLRSGGSTLLEGPDNLPSDTNGDILIYTRKGYREHLRNPKVNTGQIRMAITYPRYSRYLKYRYRSAL